MQIAWNLIVGWFMEMGLWDLLFLRKCLTPDITPLYYKSMYFNPVNLP